jgi:hypothetical protein
MSRPEALLTACWCGRRHALLAVAEIRAGRTWACSPKCLADYERRGVQYRNTSYRTDKGKP